MSRKAGDPWEPTRWAVTKEELQEGSLPLVSIGVLSFNRKEDLRSTLDAILHGVQYPNLEVIVIDNGSTDGSPEMVQELYPTVRLHVLETNTGTCARNLQSRLARGKYLFSFDDDSIPGSPASIFRMVQFLETHPEVDVVNGICYQPITAITETHGWEAFRYGQDASTGYEGIYLVEGGVCFRVDSLREVEGYDPAIFYAAEGPDLALQLYKRGRKIVLNHQFLTLHFKSALNRSEPRAAFWRARHTVWLIAKHFPPILLPGLLTLLVLRRMLGGLLHPDTARAQLRGVLAGFRGVGLFVGYRPKLTWRQLVLLKRFYIQLYRW